MGEMKLLSCGNCEELKLGVHATALGLAIVMGLYNGAAWLVRRERHLAANTVLYSVLAAWELNHVAHHWSQLGGKRDSTRGEVPASSLKTAA
jgi:hypothetical protein